MRNLLLFEQYTDETNHRYDEDFDDDFDDDDEGNTNGLRFYSDCVGWDSDEMDVLHHIIKQATEIQRSEFLGKVNMSDMLGLEKDLHYGENGMSMEKDYHVRYCRSTDLDNKPVYYFVHSAIEYCFMDTPDTVDNLDVSDLNDFTDYGLNGHPKTGW